MKQFRRFGCSDCGWRRVVYREAKRCLVSLLASGLGAARAALRRAIGKLLRRCESSLLARIARDRAFAASTAACIALGGSWVSETQAIELSEVSAGRGGFVIQGRRAGDRSGYSISGAGNVNGDSFDDVIIGARHAEESYVVFGKADGNPVDLANPLAAGEGFVIRGAGASVSGAGDVDGDGFDDVVVGSVTRYDQGSYTNESYVVFGNVSGDSVDLADVSLGTGGFVIRSGAAYSTAHSVVSGVGDVDGDGLGDISITTFSTDGRYSVGEAFVVFGKDDGDPVDLAEVGAGVGGFRIQPYSNAVFSVSAAGDVDADGLDDLVVVDREAADRITAHVIFGKVDGTPVDLCCVGAGGFRMRAGASYDSCIRASGAGDVDGDGFADVAIRFTGYDAFDRRFGNSYVVFGKPSAQATDVVLSGVGSGEGFVIPGTDSLCPGSGISFAGDVNGDCLDDIVVGAGTQQPGESYVIFGKADGQPVEIGGGSLGEKGFVLREIEAGDSAGFGVSDAGDVNGDGLSDVLVAAPDADPAGREGAGETYVVFSHLERVVPSCVPATPLELTGDPPTAQSDAVLRPTDDRRWYTVTPRIGGGSFLVVAILDDVARDGNALYARWGDVASSSAFDHAADRRPNAEPRLVIPVRAGEELSILVEANAFGGDSNQVTISVEQVAGLALAGLSAREAAQGEVVNVAVTGAGFGTDMSIALVSNEGTRIPGELVTEVSSTSVEAKFDLVGSPGFYDLVAERFGRTSQPLTDAFEIVASDVGGALQFGFDGLGFYRANLESSISVTVTNRSRGEIRAPLLKIRVPEETQLRFLSDEFEEGRNELYAIALSTRGVPDRIAPGETVKIPIVYKSSCGECPDLEIEVLRFAPGRDDFVNWVGVAPSGLQEVWPELRPWFSQTFGASWKEFQSSLRLLARRLRYRGVAAESLREAVRFAARGRPTRAIVGTVRDSGDRSLAGICVMATLGEEIATCSVTDSAGRFVLDDLSPGNEYGVSVSQHVVDRPAPDETAVSFPATVVDPEQQGSRTIADRRVDLWVSPRQGAEAPACCGSPPTIPKVATGPIVPPTDLFLNVADIDLPRIGAIDPNKKHGSTKPVNLGGERRLAFTFRIEFENDDEAEASAHTVTIIDELDPEIFDLGTVTYGSMLLGGDSKADKLVAYSSPRLSFSECATLDALRDRYLSNGISDFGSTRDERCIAFDIVRPVPETENDTVMERVAVKVRTELNKSTGELTWEGELAPPPSLPTDGWLPPDDATERGQGYFEFTVRSTPDFLTILREGGANRLKNKVKIVFDKDEARAETATVSLEIQELAPAEPTDGHVVIAPERPLRPEFSWRQPPPAHREQTTNDEETISVAVELREVESYEISWWRLGSHPNERMPPISGLPQPSFVPAQDLDLSPSTVYEWRATAVGSFGRTNSRIWTFRTADPLPDPPAAPTNPVPHDGATSVPSSTVLMWMSDAARFRISLSSLGGRHDELQDGWSDTSYRPTRLIPGETYRWRIAAMSSSPGVVTEGDSWTFTVAGAFERGDATGDGSVNTADVVAILKYLFGDEPIGCQASADVNDDESVDIGDPIYLLFAIFAGGDAPLPPFGECGSDPESSGTSCLNHPPCN